MARLKSCPFAPHTFGCIFPQGCEVVPLQDRLMGWLLGVMAAEEVVLFAGGALGALQAADKEHRHAHGHQDGDGIFDGGEPLNQAFHM